MSRYTYQLEDLSHLPTIQDALRTLKKRKKTKSGNIKRPNKNNGTTRNNN
jgi:hypothetical protein